MFFFVSTSARQDSCRLITSFAGRETGSGWHDMRGSGLFSSDRDAGDVQASLKWLFSYGDAALNQLALEKL
ncbi:MAG: hypothetical protein COW54_11480 [Rhodobacteraceae bacterium CG17_big_fil_post_rev_8_21_14_2_50_63_15]|nr:hypothetical protein [Roseovarius sp.]PIV78091.1 MAG: hypothetical protein COW54_11480 [Rhodobacteraceae bacterium CG17_big_fil_post_rev_8_21_14_2_50_63_15]